MAEENLLGPGLAISDKGDLCRVFSPAAPIFLVQGTVVGTARQNISMVGCCRLPFGTASRSVRVLPTEGPPCPSWRPARMCWTQAPGFERDSATCRRFDSRPRCVLA